MDTLNSKRVKKIHLFVSFFLLKINLKKFHEKKSTALISH